MSEIDDALIVLNGIYNGLSQIDPDLVNLQETQKDVDSAINVLLESPEKDKASFYYPACCQRLAETAILIRDYSSAIDSRCQKIIFEEKALAKTHFEDNKARLSVDIAQDCATIANYFYCAKMDDTAALLYGFAAGKDFYSTDLRRIGLYGRLCDALEFTTYHLLNKEEIKFNVSNLEFILKGNDDLIALRAPQICKIGKEQLIEIRKLVRPKKMRITDSVAQNAKAAV